MSALTDKRSKRNDVPKGRGLGAVALGWLVLSASACEMAPSSGTSGASAELIRREAGSRIPAEQLAAVGLEELWYWPGGPPSDLDAGVQSVFLLDEGLFIVSRPALGQEKRLLKRLHRENGHVQWATKIDGPLDHPPFAYTYPAAVGKPAELFFSHLDTVYRLDLGSGLHLPPTKMKFPISTAIVANETHIFAGAETGRFYAVPKGSSLDDWTHRGKGKVEAAPLLAGQRVVFAGHGGGVYGLSPERGWVNLESWQYYTGARIVADMASFSRWIFVGSADYKLYCLESLDGAVHWSFVAQAPILDAPVVYSFRPNEEYVYCIASEGPVTSPRRTLFAVPLLKGENVTRGEALWRREGVRRVVSLGKETLYVLDDASAGGGRAVSGLDVRTGALKFRLPVEGFNFVPINRANAGRNQAERGRIYLVSQTGAIQALREKL
jgi:hypothetical protein